jgi:regulator of RNase E activity RraA
LRAEEATTLDGLDGQQTRDICAALAGFDSPTVSNAIEALGIRDRTEGYTSAEIRCAYPELPPMVGIAVTCMIDTTTGGPLRPTRLFDLIDAIDAAPYPVVVVAQYVGSDRVRGLFAGDMAISMFHRLGAVGIVTDAANRDLGTIQGRAPGFQVFGLGSVSSHGNGAILDVQVPIAVGGLRVRPGDLLMGDLNGVISVPIDAIQDVLRQADLVRAEERRFFDMVADPGASASTIKEFAERQRLAPGNPDGV